ncbi:MAG: bifunctional DNA primase/polymerase [Candidatus Cryosericum sp.]
MGSGNGLTLQDQVKEYVDLGWSVLPLQPKGKEPLTEALPTINGHASWTPYQTQAASTGDILSWFADHSPEMGGTGLNIGLVTGYGSLYVLDFDRQEIPHLFQTSGTTTVKTGRGWHQYYIGPPGLASANLTSDGIPYEFKGVGSYVVAPVSTHNTGVTYDFVLPISCIKNLPEETLRNLEPHEQLPPVRPLPLRNGGRACLDEIWSRELANGERNNALYALYQGLVGKPARNSIEAAAKLLQTKNDSLQHPLRSPELRKIIRRSPEGAVPGHQYDVGCDSIHRLLDGFGWMDCKECKYADERARKVLNAAHLGTAASSLSPSACNVFLALLDEEIRTGVRFLSINGAVKATNLSRNTVRGALQELRATGFLVEGDQIVTPSSGREPKSGPTTSGF